MKKPIMGGGNNWMWLCLLVLAGTTGLPGQKIKVEYNKKQDFSQFKTYSWLKQDSYSRVFLAMDIIGAIDEQLRAKGLQPMEGNADLIVTAYGSLETDVSISVSPNVYVVPALYGTGWWTDVPVVPGSSTAVYLKKGTLVVDIAEARSKQLRWRGIINGNLDPQKKMEALGAVNKSIEKMFRQYPAQP